MTWQSALEPLTGKVQRQQYDGAMGAGVPSALTARSQPGAIPCHLGSHLQVSQPAAC